eukprot:14754982-Ditylum_brightwellii.AAC.1
MLGGGNNGLAGLIEFLQTYFLLTGQHFVQPGNPGEAPTYPPMITNAQQQAIKTQHNVAKKNYECCQRTDLLLKSDAETCMDT